MNVYTQFSLPFVEDIFPVEYLGILVDNKLCRNIRIYTCVFNCACVELCVLCFVPIPCSLDYCGFCTALYQSFSFVLVLTLLDALYFQMKFGLNFEKCIKMIKFLDVRFWEREVSLNIKRNTSKFYA